jgi:ribosomal protein L7/L12
MYEISEYSKIKASKLGVDIKPSKSKGKKIDVFKEGKKITSIGAKGYKDYPTYIKEKGKSYAEQRRKSWVVCR